MMATFIAMRIIQAANISTLDGQNKYRTYFIATPLYASYRADVDTILTTDGYGACIVTA